ncbi:hypothetical protein V2G26_001872 [Clonostachys chloroleuca]
MIKASMCTFYMRLTAGLAGYKIRIYGGFSGILASYIACMCSILFVADLYLFIIPVPMLWAAQLPCNSSLHFHPQERGHGSQRRGRMGNARVIRRHHHHQLTDDLGLDLTDAVLVQQGRHHHDGPEVYKGPRRRGTTYSCTRGAAPSRKRTSCRSGKRGGITKQVELTVSTDVSRRFHVDGLCGL